MKKVMIEVETSGKYSTSITMNGRQWTQAYCDEDYDSVVQIFNTFIKIGFEDETDYEMFEKMRIAFCTLSEQGDKNE